MFSGFHELDLRETMKDLSSVRFQEQEVLGSTHTICSYMISDPEIWNRPNGLECRGITFNEFGTIVCRPFEKFFNVNEVASTQEGIIRELYKKNGTRLQNKRDGSMLTPIFLKDRVVFKTKKSFYSDVALRAQEFAEHIHQENRFLDAVSTCVVWGYTPIFEFTSPEAQIVVDYGSMPKFVLLAIRDTETGEYIYPDDKRFRFNPWDLFTMVDWIEETLDLPSWDELMAMKEFVEEIEGWVIVLPNGQRVKVKTKWYMDRHRLIDLRYRDVAKMVVNETIDDLKANAVDRGLSMEILNQIEEQVVGELRSLIIRWNDSEAECNRLLREAGIENDGSREWWSKVAFIAKDLLPDNFGTLMSKMRGKELDYKEMWSKQFEKEYSLRSVYNINFGGTDGD